MNGSQMMTAPGKSLIKISSILMIIFSSITLVIAIVSITRIADVARSAGDAASAVNAKGLTILLYTFLPLIVAECIAGIFGIKHCSNPKKASLCMGLGLTLGAIIIFELILHFATELEIMPVMMSGIIGLILLAFYFIGILRNKKATKI